MLSYVRKKQKSMLQFKPFRALSSYRAIEKGTSHENHSGCKAGNHMCKCMHMNMYRKLVNPHKKSFSKIYMK